MSEVAGKLLISAEGVAELYDCGVSTVWHWAKAGKIPGPVVSRPKYTRWLKADIENDIARMVQSERKELAS